MTNVILIYTIQLDLIPNIIRKMKQIADPAWKMKCACRLQTHSTLVMITVYGQFTENKQKVAGINQEFTKLLSRIDIISYLLILLGVLTGLLGNLLPAPGLSSTLSLLLTVGYNRRIILYISANGYETIMWHFYIYMQSLYDNLKFL